MFRRLSKSMLYVAASLLCSVAAAQVPGAAVFQSDFSRCKSPPTDKEQKALRDNLQRHQSAAYRATNQRAVLVRQGKEPSAALAANLRKSPFQPRKQMKSGDNQSSNSLIERISSLLNSFCTASGVSQLSG